MLLQRRLKARTILAAALAAGCLLATPASAQTIYPGKAIKAPHYGDTLFEFFQDKYFSALTGLMASQHFGRLAPHDDEAEVLRGGMLLSYGNHREAAEVFERLIAQTATPAVRDRAWYYLAKIRYQRDLLTEAQAALARIEAPLPPALQEDRQLLEGQVLLARGDHAGAVRVLEPLARTKPEGAFIDEAPGNVFARFNLGVALLKSADVAEQARGQVLLDALGQEPADSEEQRNLRDRANLALGFAALQREQGVPARQFLERVRLNGPQSNKALLGFGWAAASLKQFDQAVVPWLELQGRDTSDAAVLEARLALPYAYAELGAPGQALQLYEKTLSDYDGESRRLDESMLAIREGRWVRSLLESNPANLDQLGWFAGLKDLPASDAGAMPHAAHLTQVMAQHGFQESFKNLRDLAFLERHLNQWRENLGVFQDILEHRQKVFADRLPQAQDGASQAVQALAALRQRRDALATDLAQADTVGDGVAYATASQSQALAKIASIKAVLSQQPDAEAAERLRRVEGALVWQLARDYVPRRWALQKDLATINSTLQQATQRHAALVEAQQSEPQRFTAFAQRIAALQGRVAADLPRVAALAQEQQGVVQQWAVAALQDQKDRLAAYTGQARFAIAQLVDRATTEPSAPQGAPAAPAATGADRAPR